MTKFTEFLRREDGAITVDWVVLTASIVLFGAAIGVAVSQPANELASNIGSHLATMEPTTY